jgi:hypothetical protein
MIITFTMYMYASIKAYYLISRKRSVVYNSVMQKCVQEYLLNLISEFNLKNGMGQKSLTNFKIQ